MSEIEEALRAEIEQLTATLADNEAYGYELIQQRNMAIGRAERAEAEKKRAVEANTALLNALNTIYACAVAAPSLLYLQNIILNAYNNAFGPDLDEEQKELK